LSIFDTFIIYLLLYLNNLTVIKQLNSTVTLATLLTYALMIKNLFVLSFL